MKIGVAWILRDPIILFILSLVLLVQPISAAVLAVCRFCRQGAHSKASKACVQACTERTAHHPPNADKVPAASETLEYGSADVVVAVEAVALSSRCSLRRVKSHSC